MNKKIITVMIILIGLLAVTALYVAHLNTSEENTKENVNIGSDINENDINDELDNSFIEEDDEVDIGEMF